MADRAAEGGHSIFDVRAVRHRLRDCHVRHRFSSNRDLRPDNRAPGFGIYYIWYYAGSALLPPVGGFLKDVTGTATATVLFSASMMLASLCLLGSLRWEQARYRALATKTKS